MGPAGERLRLSLMASVRRPVRIAILTISDTRTRENDTSGDTLSGAVTEAGHHVEDRRIVRDDPETIRDTLASWIANPAIETVLTSGGTGITGRDGTPEVLATLLTKEIPGFGELFRMLSYEEIGASTIQSRALGGVADTTLIFALPGSPGACRLAWAGILASQLDIDTRPCNFVQLLERLDE
jgi:molybdenum cofactor biosynthesis protein B